MRTVVAAHGSVKAILKAMDNHRAEPKVQEAACWALKELAGQVAANQDRIALTACVQALLKALEKHPNSATVEPAASNALRIFAKKDTHGLVKMVCLGRCGRLGRSGAMHALSVIKE